VGARTTAISLGGRGPYTALISSGVDRSAGASPRSAAACMATTNSSHGNDGQTQGTMGVSPHPMAVLVYARRPGPVGSALLLLLLVVLLLLPLTSLCVPAAGAAPAAPSCCCSCCSFLLLLLLLLPAAGAAAGAPHLLGCLVCLLPSSHHTGLPLGVACGWAFLIGGLQLLGKWPVQSAVCSTQTQGARRQGLLSTPRAVQEV
jgi:hypothetical protein